jgi:hypothetical protein
MFVFEIWRENDHFYGLYKKDKFILWKKLFLILNFVFLHTPHDKRVAREDVLANFLFQFFDIPKYI